MPTEPGPCPEIPPFYGNVTGAFANGMRFAARVAAPHGWSAAIVTFRRGSDGVPYNAYIGYQFEDASMTFLEFTAAGKSWPLAANSTHTSGIDDLVNEAQRDAVRFVSVWAQPDGLSPGGSSAVLTTNAGLSVTFVGICDLDVVVGSAPQMVTILG